MRAAMSSTPRRLTSLCAGLALLLATLGGPWAVCAQPAGQPSQAQQQQQEQAPTPVIFDNDGGGQQGGSHPHLPQPRAIMHHHLHHPTPSFGVIMGTPILEHRHRRKHDAATPSSTRTSFAMRTRGHCHAQNMLHKTHMLHSDGGEQGAIMGFPAEATSSQPARHRTHDAEWTQPLPPFPSHTCLKTGVLKTGVALNARHTHTRARAHTHTRTPPHACRRG